MHQSGDRSREPRGLVKLRGCLVQIFALGVILFFAGVSYSQPIGGRFRAPVFESITLEDGLPENTVNAALQDYLGYIWLGTQNGLARYDGYSMDVFKPDERDSGSISGRFISTIYEDGDRNLWIGTLNGLNLLDRSDDSFSAYRFDYYDTSTINSPLVHCMYEDGAGRFWVGTQEGLNLFDRKCGKFKRYYFTYGDSNVYESPKPGVYYLPVNAMVEDRTSGHLLIGTDLDGVWDLDVNAKNISKYRTATADIPDTKIGWVQDFYRGRDGTIWMASAHTMTGLNILKREFKSYVDFSFPAEERFTKPNMKLGSVIEDRTGLVWCGFQAGTMGLFCLDPITGEVRSYEIQAHVPQKSFFNKVFALCEDRSGIIWVGTWVDGVKKWDRRKSEFKILSSGARESGESSSSGLYSFCVDQKGIVWLITTEGLDRCDLATGARRHYPIDTECLSKYLVIASLADKSGNLWIGTSACGLLRFDTRNGTYRFCLNNPNDPENLVGKRVNCLCLDHLGCLWIGTDNYGLYKYEIANDRLIRYRADYSDPTSLSQDQVTAVFEDHLGVLWVGTNLCGFDRFDRQTGKFIHCGLQCILAIKEDSQGNLWVCDYFNGLNLIDREKNKVAISYTEKNGLASDGVSGFLEDRKGNLWVSTVNGLSRFNLKTKNVRNFHKVDGLPGDNFGFRCFDRKSNDRMVFIASGRVVYFNPDSILDDPIPPQLVLRRVSLFNQPGEKLKYNGFVSDLKELNLPRYQNDLRFDYVGLHFSEPARNTYRYKLENFDDDWVNAGYQRNATYTNLAPGRYVFRVTAANKDGVWNPEGVALTIVISPPWWRSSLAYLLYALSLFGLAYSAWRVQVRRMQTKHEFEMSRFEADKLHEVDEIKTRFFTNISHEFRTPLTLILGPVKQIAEKAQDERTREELGMVHRNANKLLRLVNQLLDIAKLESGNTNLEAAPANIVKLVRAWVLSFSSHAERKEITLNFSAAEDEIVAYVDKDKMEKIVINLLSNAFKFTPEGGRIDVNVGTSERCVNISVGDSGIGIRADRLQRIFDRYYQAGGSHYGEQEGTGIGLSLTKELVELHKGRIEVESEEGKGTTFVVSIPLGKEHLTPEDLCEARDIPGEAVHPSTEPEPMSKAEKEKSGKQVATHEGKPAVLVVEDNADVRYYVKENLVDEYDVHEAVDGEDGWNKSAECIPDVIVSDVMMPKMDGFALCRKLKTDERTSHIPVILLTARATSLDKIEGFETGADDYIMKPFEPVELKARIKNLIAQRERLHEHFKRKGIIELDELKVTPLDEKFLRRIFGLISDNMSNTSFGVEALAEMSAVSRSVLHRKIVSLTGEPPVELIRRIRLARAAELITKKAGNLSEIALEVGFTNPAYFSECFKKQFGLAPSQYHQS